jgi:hypothetical protein
MSVLPYLCCQLFSYKLPGFRALLHFAGAPCGRGAYLRDYQSLFSQAQLAHHNAWMFSRQSLAVESVV